MCILTLPALLLTSGCGRSNDDANAPGTVHAKFASEEIEGDFMTVWAHQFADHMREASEGQLDISVYPYGSLGDTRDINELAQLGVVDFVFTDFAWISSFVPEAQVLALHYIWPQDNTPAVLEWVVRHGEFMPRLEAAFRSKKLVPLAVMYEGWQWVTAKNAARTLEDVRGMKTRLMGSKLLVEQYRSYGISPTPMSYGEVYSALQTGLIDAQVNPLFANYSMKFYEVTDHFTQMWAEPFLSIPAVNAEFFDALSPELQQAMRDYFTERIMEAADWIDARNAADRKRIVEERPNVVWTEWNDATIEQARQQVSEVRNTIYPKLAGDEAGEILAALLSDIEAAKMALGAATNSTPGN